MTTVIQGMPASFGIASGAARLVRGVDPHDAAFERGDVLVVPFSNPMYYRLFLLASAVVAEFGGVTSHAAGLARELGLPCVVGAADAMTLIADGQYITVSGLDGTVRVEPRR